MHTIYTRQFQIESFLCYLIFVNTGNSNSVSTIKNMSKRAFWSLRQTKGRINMRIRTVWLEFLCNYFLSFEIWFQNDMWNCLKTESVSDSGILQRIYKSTCGRHTNLRIIGIKRHFWIRVHLL